MKVAGKYKKQNAIKPVFEDLGFSKEESSAMRVRAELYFALQDIIEKEGYNSRELERILDQPQPRISELKNGKISSLSIEKLLDYLERLGKKVSVKVSAKKRVS